MSSLVAPVIVLRFLVELLFMEESFRRKPYSLRFFQLALFSFSRENMKNGAKWKKWKEYDF
ncbi:hypothetical protein KSS87_012734 [Heliosperma pusillum]|nr:hypothetical protein KSS87_012734 [Heliosperma pusillum]